MTKILKNNLWWLSVLLLGTVASVSVRTYFILNGAAVSDILRMYQVAVTVLEGQNPYMTPGFYIYSPLWMYIEVLTLTASRELNLSFQSLIKFWPNIADVLTVVFIYIILIKQKTKKHWAALWSLVYILNPVSVIISSIHGQFDSVVSFFTLLAIFFLTSFEKKKYFLLSGLALGIAIAFKSNPIVLVPFLLFFKKTSLKDELYYLFLVGIPTVLVLLPFVSTTFREALGSLMGYSGFNDFGIGGVLRGLWYQDNAQLSFPYASEFLNLSKFVYLGLLLALFVKYLRSKPTAENLYLYVLMVYLLFLVVYSGISGQYFSWVLFAAVILRQKILVWFSLAASLALIGFYLFFNPTVILSTLNIFPHQSLYMSWYFFTNLLTWLVSLFWLVRLTIGKLK